MQDAFPISIVDELLDELHGTKFFTKLDLRWGYHQVLMNPANMDKTTFAPMKASMSSSSCRLACGTRQQPRGRFKRIYVQRGAPPSPNNATTLPTPLVPLAVMALGAH
jgi:hypothetical protein